MTVLYVYQSKLNKVPSSFQKLNKRKLKMKKNKDQVGVYH